MKTAILFLVICVAAVACLPRYQERIVGGSVTNINQYPFAATLQRSTINVVFLLACGATIVTNRSLLSAAHCWPRAAIANRHRVRVGSTNRNSGGSFLTVSQLTAHPQYNSRNLDNDIGMIRVSDRIPIGSASVRVASLPAANINIADNSNVIALGWGQISTNGPLSQNLRHVTLRTVSQSRCSSDFRGGITANMLCAHWQGGGRGICFGDSGTGLVFNNAVVGVSSFIGSDGCGSARFPSVFARVSRFITWINNNS